MAPRVIQEVPTEKLKRRKQPRKRLARIEELAQSVAVNGILQAILAYREKNGDLYVYEGHRRLIAAEMAGLKTVPVDICDKELVPAEILARQIVTNLLRDDWTIVERARGFDEYMKVTNSPAAELARVTGLSEASISRDLTLLTMAPDILERVENGQIPASTAYQIAIAGDAEAQQQLADDVVSGKLSRAQVVARVKAQGRTRTPRKPRRISPQTRVVLPLGGGRSVAVAGPGLALDTLLAWVEELVSRIKAINAPAASLADVVKLLAGGGS